MKRILNISTLAVVVAAVLSACKTNEYLPPDWAYPIPQTTLDRSANLGAYYTMRTTQAWAEGIKDTPLLNIVSEEGEEPQTVVYTTNLNGIMTQQCKWADQAGIDFFIFPWNATAENRELMDIYLYYREIDNPNVKVVFNYSFGHLSLGAEKQLVDFGEAFDQLVAEFKTLYTDYFSQDFYYRLPDGRPVILFPGTVNENVDFSLFIGAFRQAMSEFTVELQEADPSIPSSVMDFYIIGEVSGNWLPPQRNESVSKYLDGNFVKQWYPTRYYERWYAFYSYTDMAWENWRNYSANWGNDFVPCIFPEYYVTESGSRSIERTEDNYVSFCNVAKRNIGSNYVVIINSWNEFETGSALEPALEYGERYLDITREQFKK